MNYNSKFKFTIILSFLLLSAIFTMAQTNLSALIPMPNKCTTIQNKFYQIRTTDRIYSNNSKLDFAASCLQNIISRRLNLSLNKSDNITMHNAGICLMLDNQMKGREHYSIKIDASKILISGATPEAVLYGVMTFDQLMLGDVCRTSKHQITAVTIDDSPRIERRALMLDPARNFIPAKDVKVFMDQMMKYKYNVLQLHLTDDQGWRMEIKGEPKLTAAGPFYTQDELKELIEYGAKRNIEIVPELDIPGHTVAILAAYPELGCTTSDTIKKVLGKTTNLMLCASQEGVYTIYHKIINQVANLFPSPYIHLGGDESVINKNWGMCERCKKLMSEKGYTQASQLMIPFFERMLGFVKEGGKQAMLWCELNDIRYPANKYLFPYPKDVLLVSWRDGLTPTCIDLTNKSGNKMLLAPGEYTYFDYPQLKGDLPEFNNWGMPITTLKKCYEFDPGYNLPADKQNHIVGVMGTLWGEAIKDINRVFYMTYPRAFALSEAGWTQMQNRSWQSFKQRLYPNLLDLIKQGISVRAPYEIANE